MPKTIVMDHDDRVTRWVAERVGQNGQWGSHQAIGLEEDGQLVAGMVVESYVKDTRCCVHLAGTGKRWLNRDFLWFGFHYMFDQLRCKVVVGLVNSGNADALRFDRHIGWVEACRIQDGAKDGDLVVMTMHREQCKWLNKTRRGQ